MGQYFDFYVRTFGDIFAKLDERIKDVEAGLAEDALKPVEEQIDPLLRKRLTVLLDFWKRLAGRL